MIPGGLVSIHHALKFNSRLRAIAAGYSATAQPGLHGLSDERRVIGFIYRSYNIFTLRPNGELIAAANFDIYGNSANATAAANYLNAIPAGTLVVVITNDEPNLNHTLNGFPAAMQRCGAGNSYMPVGLTYRSAYILIGKAGIGLGKGTEYYKGDSPDATNSFIDVSFTVSNNNYSNIVVNQIG